MGLPRAFLDRAVAKGARVVGERPAKQRPAHVWGQLNKTEAAFARQLDALKQAGRIRDWQFEAITLRLAPTMRYTPDFDVWNNDGSLDFHETKGGREWEDAIVKLKTAAVRFPRHRFYLDRLIGTEWSQMLVQNGEVTYE